MKEFINNPRLRTVDGVVNQVENDHQAVHSISI